MASEVTPQTIKTGESETQGGADTAWLVCPNCGGTNLHQDAVTVFDVEQEDAKKVTRTRVSGGVVSSHLVPNRGSGNPSRRRHGLVISFECEGCTASPIELRIAQHKGNTEVSWRYTTQPATK
jgi:hypothetical protein